MHVQLLEWIARRRTASDNGYRAMFDDDQADLALDVITSGRVLIRKANASWTNSGCSPYSTPIIQRTLVQSKMAQTISTIILLAS